MDDLVLFAKSEVASCITIRDALLEFECLSRLRTNADKSECYFSSTSHDTKESLLAILVFGKGSFHLVI